MRTTYKQVLSGYKYLLGLLVSKMSLEIIYYIYISPNYDYMGLNINISVYKIIESYLLLCILFIFTPNANERISHFFLHIQLVVTILPMLSLYGLNDQNRVYMYMVCICHLLQSGMVKCSLFQKHIRFPQISYKHLYRTVFIGVVIVILYSIHLYGFPTFKAFNLDNIYEIRRTLSWGFPISYIVTWSVKIFIPLGMVIAIHRKKYLGMLMMQIGLIILFLLFAQKSFLFNIIFVTAVYIVCHFKILYEALYYVIPVISFLGTTIYNILGTIVPLSYLIRRVFFVPAQIKFVYYDFFNIHQPYYFADGQIGRLLSLNSAYDFSIAKTIGGYMGDSDTAANTGYLGEGYAQARFLGMILFSILIIVFLKIIELCSYKINSMILVPAASYWLYSLNDSALLTSLLTGGGIFLIILFGISEKEISSEVKNK